MRRPRAEDVVTFRLRDARDIVGEMDVVVGEPEREMDDCDDMVDEKQDMVDGDGSGIDGGAGREHTASLAANWAHGEYLFLVIKSMKVGEI